MQRDLDGAQRVVIDDKKLDILEIETERGRCSSSRCAHQWPETFAT